MLDDVLTKGLIAVVAGRIVILWTTTSTSSASGDDGADPNKVAWMADDLDATTMTPLVAQESFRTIAGPTYGAVYRGVAFVPWAPLSGGTLARQVLFAAPALERPFRMVGEPFLRDDLSLHHAAHRRQIGQQRPL